MDHYNYDCYSVLINSDENSKFDLITAASVGDLRLVQQLLRASNCNPNLTNTSGWTSLMYAAHYGHYNVIRMLIDHNADVNLQEWVNGKTALMLAASNGHTRCVEVLINHGRANIHLTDYAGQAASYYAIHFGHGNNKIIAKLLGIKDNRNTPRAITKLAVRKPKIMITETNGNVQREDELTPSNKHQNGNISPILPFLHYATIKDSGNSSNKLVTSTLTFDEFKTQVHRNNDETPILHVSSALATRRKRRLTLDVSGSSNSLESNESGSANGSNGRRKSADSPPLPDSLEKLLTRIELEHYYQLFATSGIDLYTFLTLTENDFKEMGISVFGHRRKLIAAQERFRESVEIRNTQESFFADWLLNEREQLKAEL
ncbi:ankyrin repeat and SAM domain-containing protein 3-like protein, partial [Dinothrombium tinctorium]